MVKHLTESLEGITVGEEVTVELNTKQHQALVLHLLDWLDPACQR
jgi:hypothetical protein